MSQEFIIQTRFQKKLTAKKHKLPDTLSRKHCLSEEIKS